MDLPLHLSIRINPNLSHLIIKVYNLNWRSLIYWLMKESQLRQSSIKIRIEKIIPKWIEDFQWMMKILVWCFLECINPLNSNRKVYFSDQEHFMLAIMDLIQNLILQRTNNNNNNKYKISTMNNNNNNI